MESHSKDKKHLIMTNVLKWTSFNRLLFSLQRHNHHQSLASTFAKQQFQWRPAFVESQTSGDGEQVTILPRICQILFMAASWEIFGLTVCSMCLGFVHFTLSSWRRMLWSKSSTSAPDWSRASWRNRGFVSPGPSPLSTPWPAAQRAKVSVRHRASFESLMTRAIKRQLADWSASPDRMYTS